MIAAYLKLKNKYIILVKKINIKLKHFSQILMKRKQIKLKIVIFQ
jgi:hypothetical protein